MFAVLKTGGKQYRVQAGDVLRVEKLAADAGEKVQFNEILMVGATVGTPMVDGAAVQAEVIDQIKGDKVIHFVRRRRKHSSKRTKGHRQQLTLLRVTDILEKGADTSGVMAAVASICLTSRLGSTRPSIAFGWELEIVTMVVLGFLVAGALSGLDPELAARIQAGATGPEIESQLNAQGFTLGHFPQSFEFSTLGGWIATRSAGQNSTGYGKIEDMTQAVRVVTPSGVVETKDTPATAAGGSRWAWPPTDASTGRTRCSCRLRPTRDGSQRARVR